MATMPTTEASAQAGRIGDSLNYLDITVELAGKMARPTFRRGDLAELRRMKPDEPDPAVFWRLLAESGLLETGDMSPAVESKWGLILHGIALTTPTSRSDANTDSDAPRPSAHNPTVPVGLALFQGGDSNRTRAFYSETRLNRLLTARGPMLHTLLARTFRMLGSDQPFNWRQMARLILHEGYREDSAEYVRHQIARAYYQAERRSSQQSGE